MKKILIVFAVVIAASWAVSFFRHTMLKDIKNVPAAGGTPEDFILGMNSSITYRLSDFIGKNVIALAFLDSSLNSRRFEEACAENLRTTFKDRHDLIWFNIKKENSHAVIMEQTKILSLMYRTPYSGIPEFYGFSSLPTVILIDKTGTIKLIYNGYSPTIFNDIKNSLPKTAK